MPFYSGASWPGVSGCFIPVLRPSLLPSPEVQAGGFLHLPQNPSPREDKRNPAGGKEAPSQLQGGLPGGQGLGGLRLRVGNAEVSVGEERAGALIAAPRFQGFVFDLGSLTEA